jgi:hypothetical protein
MILKTVKKLSRLRRIPFQRRSTPFRRDDFARLTWSKVLDSGGNVGVEAVCGFE